MSALVSPALQENYQRRAWDITGRDLLLTGFDDTPLLYTQTPAVRQALVEKTAARLQAGSLLDRLMPTLSQASCACCCSAGRLCANLLCFYWTSGPRAWITCTGAFLQKLWKPVRKTAP